MAEIKLSKQELRLQRARLKQLEKYLPTLQLKKAMLQAEVNEVRLEIERLEGQFHEIRLNISRFSGLFSSPSGVDIREGVQIAAIQKRYENIAGVDIPLFEGVTFVPFDYPLFGTPAWVDASLFSLQELAIARAKLIVAKEKREALEKELRQVSIRVNLFEKNLIPGALKNIRKIKVFLGDQELAAVSQAKAAKAKIERRRAQREQQSR